MVARIDNVERPERTAGSRGASVEAGDPGLAALPKRRLRLSDYETLVATGAFEGERVELLFGEIVAMSPQKPTHRILTQRIGRDLTLALGANANVQSHSPVRAVDDSCPEPDVAVYAPEDDRTGEHPRTVHLVVEVSDDSRFKDLGPKRRLYALSGFPEYWVVDVQRREVRVMRDPDGDEFRTVTTHSASEGGSLSPVRFPELSLPIAPWFDGL